jgi:hypothetical protein
MSFQRDADFAVAPQRQTLPPFDDASDPRSDTNKVVVQRMTTVPENRGGRFPGRTGLETIWSTILS